VDEVRNKVSISVLGQIPSKQALLQKVQRSRNEELKAPANPTDFNNLIIPHRFAFHQKRGMFLVVFTGCLTINWTLFISRFLGFPKRFFDDFFLHIAHLL
jgi:hypothetical protein